MPEQLSMFDLFRPAPILRPVSSDGQVVQDRIHTVFRLRHPRYAFDRARIEIHPHEAMWMWATTIRTDQDHYSGYRVGAKWGHFADTIEDAIYWAVREIREALELCKRSSSRAAIERWLALYEPLGYRPEAVRRVVDMETQVSLL